MTGVIFDIKRFAVHDGPGIRTTVFLKGCDLRCPWCHNPESQGYGVETLDGRDGPLHVGRQVTVDEVVAEIERDAMFFDESGGGVTFSGGEPLGQPEFLCAALDRCGELGIHRAVDTSGYAPRDVLLRVAERTDLFLYDLKFIDAEVHMAMTGVEVTPIHDNLRALCQTGVAIQLRIPVVPGMTNIPQNMEAVGELIASLPRTLDWKLLPYHRAAMDKYPRFGMAAPLPHTREPNADEMQQMAECIRSATLSTPNATASHE
jgi:pyruvate formate lyase activating enzyme